MPGHSLMEERPVQPSSYCPASPENNYPSWPGAQRGWVPYVLSRVLAGLWRIRPFMAFVAVQAQIEAWAFLLAVVRPCTHPLLQRLA